MSEYYTVDIKNKKLVNIIQEAYDSVFFGIQDGVKKKQYNYNTEDSVERWLKNFDRETKYSEYVRERKLSESSTTSTEDIIDSLNRKNIMNIDNNESDLIGDFDEKPIGNIDNIDEICDDIKKNIDNKAFVDSKLNGDIKNAKKYFVAKFTYMAAKGLKEFYLETLERIENDIHILKSDKLRLCNATCDFLLAEHLGYEFDEFGSEVSKPVHNILEHDEDESEMEELAEEFDDESTVSKKIAPYIEHKQIKDKNSEQILNEIKKVMRPTRDRLRSNISDQINEWLEKSGHKSRDLESLDILDISTLRLSDLAAAYKSLPKVTDSFDAKDPIKAFSDFKIDAMKLTKRCIIRNIVNRESKQFLCELSYSKLGALSQKDPNFRYVDIVNDGILSKVNAIRLAIENGKTEGYGSQYVVGVLDNYLSLYKVCFSDYDCGYEKPSPWRPYGLKKIEDMLKTLKEPNTTKEKVIICFRKIVDGLHELANQDPVIGYSQTRLQSFQENAKRLLSKMNIKPELMKSEDLHERKSANELYALAYGTQARSPYSKQEATIILDKLNRGAYGQDTIFKFFSELLLLNNERGMDEIVKDVCLMTENTDITKYKAELNGYIFFYKLMFDEEIKGQRNSADELDGLSKKLNDQMDTTISKLQQLRNKYIKLLQPKGPNAVISIDKQAKTQIMENTKEAVNELRQIFNDAAKNVPIVCQKCRESYKNNQNNKLEKLPIEKIKLEELRLKKLQLEKLRLNKFKLKANDVKNKPEK